MDMKRTLRALLSMKYVMIFWICSLSFLSYSQTHEPAHIYLYRTSKMVCNAYEFDVQFKGRDIYSMRKNTAIDYSIESTGKLKVEIKNWAPSWYALTWLKIEQGKKYYIKIDCSVTGLQLTVNGPDAEMEWITSSKGNLVTLMEDPNDPLIEPERTEPKQEAVKVRTDTVKQIIYVTPKESDVSTKKYVYQPSADVDFNIPSSGITNDLTFALIIGNEDYSSFQNELKKETNVDYARNDASTFKEYLIKTIGVPEKNITLLYDATYGQISQALSKLNLIAKNTNGKAKLVFYYAGHGMPDEVTKEAYLMPVDVSATNVTGGIKLKDVYGKLTEQQTEQVTVIIDACFTGGARNQGLIAARGVSIKPKEEFLKGKIVVFNSSSGTQSSLPYHDKKHGLFTYYLLKKLQETKGNITLKDMSVYLNEKVGLEAILINNKEQNPETNVSPDVSDKWESWKFN